MIRIGTSGFSFKDWLGVVYPKKLKLKDALCYYQDELGFDCVEINSTYYTLVSARSFEGMEEKTGPGFEFVVKGYRGITHDPFDNRLKDKKPTLRQAHENIKRFIYSIQPLKEKKKLGAVLLQFPVFFYPGSGSRDYLIQCKELFSGIPLVIEFRNCAWAKPPTFEFLREQHLAFCAVDEPQLPRLMPFIDEVTSSIGYLRFHGRNKHWFNTPVDERHNYRYSEQELKDFLPEIKKMDKESKTLYIFFNNCHAGLAAKNAMMLRDLLGLPVSKKQPDLIPV
jgi:uncharacterized protein YecE (DUF72 family)